MLVVSAILRLDLYVDVYSLTYWRVAAFVWMGIVACGLVLIVARIALNRSNGWLIVANLCVVGATLYVCSFVNFADLVARYNVQHSREISGRGVPLDIGYLFRLGPQAIPAFDGYLARRPDGAGFRKFRDTLVLQHVSRQADWRAWSYRGWALGRYLDANPNAPLPASAGVSTP